MESAKLLDAQRLEAAQSSSMQGEQDLQLKEYQDRINSISKELDEAQAQREAARQKATELEKQIQLNSDAVLNQMEISGRERDALEQERNRLQAELEQARAQSGGGSSQELAKIEI